MSWTSSSKNGLSDNLWTPCTYFTVISMHEYFTNLMCYKNKIQFNSTKLRQILEQQINERIK